MFNGVYIHNTGIGYKGSVSNPIGTVYNVSDLKKIHQDKHKREFRMRRIDGVKVSTDDGSVKPRCLFLFDTELISRTSKISFNLRPLFAKHSLFTAYNINYKDTNVDLSNISFALISADADNVPNRNYAENSSRFPCSIRRAEIYMNDKHIRDLVKGNPPPWKSHFF